MPLKSDAALRKDRTNAYSPMEHRHFATIAAILDEYQGSHAHEIAHHFADRLERTNPRFDRDRFLAACGVV